MAHLLDVNVLLALVDRMHVHHQASRRWFRNREDMSWATCPLTENGFIRVCSHPRNPSRPGDASVTADLLMTFCSHPDHQFWPADIRLVDLIKPGQVFSHGQVTDLYLLGLAIRNGGKLATLDRRIPAALLEQGNEALTLISV